MSTTTTTQTQIAEDPSHHPDGRRLARIQYLEPETSVDPWDCHYFGIPIPKAVLYATLPLNDLRPSIFSPENPYKLSTHAFTALKHESALDIAAGEALNKEKANEVLIPEIEEILKSVTGAKDVFVLGLGLRMKEPDPDTIPLSERDPNAEPERCGIDLPVKTMDMSKPYLGGYDEGQKIGPAKSMHIDYSPDGARQILRNVRGDVFKGAKDIIAAEDEAVKNGEKIEDYEGRRYGMFSIWRPLRKVTRDPVAVCDPNSINLDEDLVEHINKQPSDKGDYLAGLSMLKGDKAESQKWYYVSEMDVDEVFVFQFYDSYAMREGRPWGAPHGGVSFVGAGAEEGELRNSVEARCIAIW